MADHHPSSVSEVPAELVRDHRQGWQFFTKATAYGCIGIVVFLLLMLLFFKIL